MVGFHKPPSGIGNDRQPAKLSNSGKEQANRFADDDAEFLALEISKSMQHKFRSFMVTSLAAAGLGLIAWPVARPAKADAWDKMTYVTIHEPVIAGNKVLQPGTYVWKLLDSQSDRHIVQIFDKDQRHIEETILAIPNYRLAPTG